MKKAKDELKKDELKEVKFFGKITLLQFMTGLVVIGIVLAYVINRWF